MEMHQARYFLAVCETLNFTRAAEQCHVAQPSLTRAIKKLEEELGGPLFRRERTRNHLTELGRLVRPHLERVVFASRAAADEAQCFIQMETAVLRLGVMSTIGPQRLIGFLDRLRRDVPNLDLSIEEARGKDLVGKLLDGELDVALIGLPHFPERLDARPLYDERYVIGFRQGHRFEDMALVPLNEIDAENYVLRTHCEFTDYYEALGLPKDFEANVRYSSEREDWVQAMILAGMGCSIMPEFLPNLAGIGTRVLVNPEVSRTIHLVTVSGRRFSPAVERLVRVAQHYDWEAATGGDREGVVGEMNPV